jgi:hypothetical protein
MNPIRWQREHQVAGIAICIIGAIFGLLFAWVESPVHRIAVSNISGGFSNYANVFLGWLLDTELYWPFPFLGAIITGLAFYAMRLLKHSN